ncbi:UDP-Glycosyltransferase/glycogen phosphorylase [Trametes punicea]|nr:UDP-Glycosyltransferase/glycogen phosphorylase [Trametes punicea]
MAPRAEKHILLCPAHMWGHARGLFLLAGRIVRLRPVVVTLCIPDKLYDRATAEILSDFSPADTEYLSRIQQGSDHIDPAVIRDHYLELWSSLCSGESALGQFLDGTPCLINLHTSPLNAVVFDCTLVEVMQALHKQRTTSAWPLNLHIYIWAPLTMNYLASRFRIPDILPFIEAVASREGISFRQAACVLLNTKRGELTHPPGLPPMYDYEFEPQGFTWSDDLNERVFAPAAGNLYNMDGILSVDAVDYHPTAAAAYREFLAEHGKKLYIAGPLISKDYPAPTLTNASDADTVMRFMDQQVKVRGEKCSIYVSFGSLFWPQDPAKLVAVLDLLAEQNIPFIISRPSPVAKLPDDLLQRLMENPNVYVGGWLPQQAILDHPAIGWCLTHGGHNTVLECIHSGVPMIVWPITVDQAPNAVHLDVNLEIAYELLEVRTGVGLDIVHRTGKAPLGTIDTVRDELRDVLAHAFGEDGAAKRARLLGLREKLEAAWSEHGTARKAVETFLDEVCALPASTLNPVRDA